MIPPAEFKFTLPYRTRNLCGPRLRKSERAGNYGDCNKKFANGSVHISMTKAPTEDQWRSDRLKDEDRVGRAEDTSNGYEAVAEDFTRLRLQSPTGLAIVRKWAASLPRGGCVLDVGAGSGEPLTAALIEAGLDVFAIDASPTMVAAFQRRFPGVKVACEPAEYSRFFERTFDGALAIGLVFLLPADNQRQLIRRMAAALKPGGRLLFSAPREVCVWDDLLTGQPSSSLGADEYRRIAAGSGLHILGEHVDEGGNHYYEARAGRC